MKFLNRITQYLHSYTGNKTRISDLPTFVAERWHRHTQLDPLQPLTTCPLINGIFSSAPPEFMGVIIMPGRNKIITYYV